MASFLTVAPRVFRREAHGKRSSRRPKPSSRVDFRCRKRAPLAEDVRDCNDAAQRQPEADRVARAEANWRKTGKGHAKFTPTRGFARGHGAAGAFIDAIQTEKEPVQL